jgi:UDP-N-acetylmuramoyl-L-alanyl-D-glutamate--2,6-diaminopimelate ligase
MVADFNTHNFKQLLADWYTAVHHTPHTQPPPYTGPDITLTHLTESTDDAKPGACFVARVRTGSDGHPWIGKAIEQGASMILAQRSPEGLGLTVPDNIVYWQVPDTAETLAWLSAAWHGFPSCQIVTIGVTGTNGKTTIVETVYAILRAAGLKTGMISTIKAIIGDEEESTGLHVSTPEAPAVQAYLRRMVEAGMTHCVLETTSHGLEQHRVTAVDYDIAVISNITHEHIDYHGTHAAYFAAKARLFERLHIGNWHVKTANDYKREVIKTAVLNRDDSSYEKLSTIPAPRQLSYSSRTSADITATQIEYAADNTHFTLTLPGHSTPITTALVGEFNVQNLLAAAAAGEALGLDTAVIRQGIESVTEISGRMQRIDRGQPFLTLVDFAHTHDALEKAIAAARGMTNGRIITVFGSAGKRDVEKRRLMSEVAARDADLTVLTAEDPRTESLDAILAMMAEGCERQDGIEHQTFWRVPDRGEAIYFALGLAQADDLVLICGKGHEQSMCFGTIEYPWDDRDATIAALDAFLSKRPMIDLGLPTYTR